jgi:hypothetical protein
MNKAAVPDIDPVVRTIEELARRGAGRLIGVWIGVEPGFSAESVAEAIRGRCRGGHLEHVNIHARQHGGPTLVITAEYAPPR